MLALAPMSAAGAVPDEILARWQALLPVDRLAAEDFYFETILPPLLATLERRPSHQALRAQGYDTLVSLMGFSPETTVMSAALLRPQTLLVVLSEKAEASYDRAHAFLTAHKILRHSQIEKVTIPPTDPRTIYNEIRHAVLRGGAAGGARKRIFDVTGGKKIMSATAGQVAWEADWPLCYIESGAYDPALRRPLPGHEELMFLPSPSQRHAREARKTALGIYRSRNYVAAADAFAASLPLGTENRLECLGLDLCRVYALWADLDLPKLGDSLQRLAQRLGEPRILDLLRGGRADADALARHVQALGAVARGDRMALIATFLELGVLYSRAHRHDFACLLAYRAMEALVEHALKTVAGDAFDRESPDYRLLGDPVELAARYTALSEKIGGQPERALPAQIGFLNGLMLLCLVDHVHARFERPMAELSFIQMLRAEARRRNASVLAHGGRTLGETDSATILEKAEQLAQAALRAEGWEQLRAFRRDLAPLALEALEPGEA
jgi:hypothetical protein